MMKILLKYLNNHKLIFLGALMFSIYIWARFIRKRLSKDIPFHPNILGFAILIEICCIYAYIVFALMRPPKEPNPIVEEVINLLYKPLEDFDYFWKNAKLIRKSYKTFMLFLLEKLKRIIIKNNIFYFYFAIFPRLVFIFIMFIDVFIFNKLHYIYYVILLGILLFLSKYIIYSIKIRKNQLLEKFMLYYDAVSTPYVYGVDPDDNEEDEDWEPAPTMALAPDIFVKHQVNCLVYQNTKPDYMIFAMTDYYVRKSKIKYNIPLEQQISLDFLRLIREKREQHLNTIIDLSVLLEYYELSKSHQDLKLIKQLIFINYLVFWIYVLIISLPYLNIPDLITIMNLTWLNMLNPFL